ncbi:Uncharacterised protein (plasmid) [Tsukamurella tyrosinosolvens]|uniref:Uncharacterized protein n=1 Tax=Tsukamurella tyrosinosolvens TaxID=57704 RepID=A0A1H4V4M0_TSUTY|nr:hypothetical protein [Tsukamurella tyrosinosolvens]SEC76052.1 hypothetical protein SAMN04489793_3143 [Tsukamurella tyrosinosolvens]VEH90682.1 Uncharacterised protein [Tsukamurella tyrosinosolvens]
MSDSLARDVFQKQFAALNAQIAEKGALIEDVDDPTWRGVDPEIMGADFMRIYEGMTSAGYARGWL